MTAMRVRHKHTGHTGKASHIAASGKIYVVWDDWRVMLDNYQRSFCLVFIVPAGRRIIDTRANWKTFRDEPIRNTGPLDADIL